jgi:hypothetical protein
MVRSQEEEVSFCQKIGFFAIVRMESAGLEALAGRCANPHRLKPPVQHFPLLTSGTTITPHRLKPPVQHFPLLTSGTTITSATLQFFGHHTSHITHHHLTLHTFSASPVVVNGEGLNVL